MLGALLVVLCLGQGSGSALARTVQPASAKLSQRAQSVVLPNTTYMSCTIQTPRGYYLTAVDGGGRTTNVIHTDATRASTWERFNLYYQGYANAYAFQTSVTLTYLSAMGGGGHTTDVIHSNVSVVQSWERFNLVLLGVRNDGVGLFAIQTINGNYLTALNEGGHQDNSIHSDATSIGAWEEFYIGCNNNTTSPFGN